MAQITCPKCGKQLPEDAKFCSYCGCTISTESSTSEKVEENTESRQEEVCMKDIWVCPDCGLEMEEEKESCPYCACPNSFFEHKQVDRKTVVLADGAKTEKKKTPKWIYFVILAIVAYGGFVVADGISQHRKEEAAREAEYQRRVEEEQRQKKLKEERINNLKYTISGNTYSCSRASLYSYSVRNEFYYYFRSNGSGTWKFYEISAFGYDLKNSGTISWWIDDKEYLVVKDNEGNTDYFTIYSTYIQHNNGDKYLRQY